MIYNVEDKLSFKQTLVYSLQQFLAVVCATILVPILCSGNGVNMSPAAAAMLPTAAPVRPIRPGLPGSSLGLFSGGTTGVPVLNFGSTVMLRSADVSPLPGIEMRNGSQSYALLAFAELVRETRYRPSGRFWKVS